MALFNQSNTQWAVYLILPRSRSLSNMSPRQSNNNQQRYVTQRQKLLLQPVDLLYHWVFIVTIGYSWKYNMSMQLLMLLFYTTCWKVGYLSSIIVCWVLRNVHIKGNEGTDQTEKNCPDMYISSFECHGTSIRLVTHI